MERQDERLARKAEEADLVAKCVNDLLWGLIASGFSADAVLSGAHVQIAAVTAVFTGGPMAAQSLERAADRVRNLPSQHALALACAEPAGRA